MKDAIICDLDGTLADDSHRAVHLHPAEVRDWDLYYSLCHLDKPNHAVIAILQRFVHSHDIFILTGRIQRTQATTVDWLERHDVPYHYLQMRGDHDRTEDTDLKIDWAVKLFDLKPERVLFVLEDRRRVVDAWRKSGYRCFQVADHNF